MNTECTQLALDLQAAGERLVVVKNDGQEISSDGGLLVLARMEERLQWIHRLGDCFLDGRQSDRVVHGLEPMLRQMIFGLVQGYEDLNDHDLWRKDPLLALACGLEPYQEWGAGKSTLNRLQLGRDTGDRYKKISYDPQEISRLLVELFLDWTGKAPEEIVLDFDASDIPLHGDQEGKFFHGYYDEYCYLPLFCFCGQFPLMAQLRMADRDASHGVVTALEWMIPMIRARWPKTRIILRGDSGFCREPIMTFCEARPRMNYVLGIARNSRLTQEISVDLKEMERLCIKYGQPRRHFRELQYRTLGTWSRSRRVVAKAEAIPGKTNPRFIVTNLTIKQASGRWLYEKTYCARGDMENRIKEHQSQLFSTRTSCHEFRANQLRLWLSTFAYLFYVELRSSAWKNREPSRWEPRTIRLKILKVAAVVTVSHRRIVVQLPRSFPYWEWFQQAC